MTYAPEQLTDLSPDDIVLESLPEEIVAAMESRDRWVAGLPQPTDAFEFLVSDVQAWAPDQVVRVAFMGGDTTLHNKIADACQEITDACGITLDFGGGRGGFRTWTTRDTEHAAEIRVSFDMGGYFSLVGTDSISTFVPHQSPVGGRPNQRSLNLGGYDQALPPRWKGTVLHEFLHALAFHHEHQNTRGPCEAAFRWDDDPGYQPVQDRRGRFIPDASGRRPGIYTYLSGFPNFWSRAKVDHNLRGLREGGGITAGRFDPASIMLYRFPAMFYRTTPSPCAPIGDGESLSEGDKAALLRLYPEIPDDRKQIVERRMAVADEIEQQAREMPAATFIEPTVTQLRAGIT
ncbi:hypothetical protein [Thermomonospora cellulosilytica]|uniref:Peptidase metallopeptidase domain-containing protein n=1 Tax=Thermomonospora cellulosilytica TaxID=1411118 RepID=A0A7W3R7C4_9ACTN|nr:hypothetical protein [Thermomonospora cellulosilytica]MBA9002537.1 hypothetical protein [Thermomonospora cellulosilytica]